MPVPNTSFYGVQQKPSCYDRVLNSFMMGATIGITIGMLFGGVGGFRYSFFISFYHFFKCLVEILNYIYFLI